MSNPVRSDVHVNRPLTAISVATIQAESDFIHQQVFPNVPVLKQSDLYFKYTRDYWFRSGAQKRAPATESAGSGFHLTTDSYFCDKWAFHMDLDDDTVANADMLSLDKSATEFVTRNLLLRREQLFMQRYLAPGVWAGNLATNSMGVLAPADYTPDISWSDASSNPVADVAKLKIGIKRITSLSPNTMVVSPDVNEALKQHPLVIDRIKYTQKGIATEELLAQLFGVDKYLVASAVYNSSQEAQLANYNFISNNKFLLCYAAPAPGIMVPSAGYIMSWSGLFGGSAYGSRIKRMRMEHLEADRIEGEMAFDMKLVASDLGVLGTNLLSV